MEEAMIVSDSNTTMESDMKGEYSSDTNNESEVENDDIEITFGPWPPFPSKQDTEVSEDQIQMTINSEDSSQPFMLYEQESVGSEISLDEHIDLESVEDFIKTDGIISQCVQTDETETADVSGQHEVLTSNKAYTMKDRLNDPEFTTDDEGKIPTDDSAVTDSSVHSGSDIIADIGEQTANLASLHTEYDDVTSKCVPSDSDSRSANSDCDVDSSSSIHINEHTKKMIIPPTECGDVIKKYVPSESGMSLNVNESVISDVINEQSQITPDIVVKDEPVTDGYPDSTQMVIAQDDNLFVSTEHGKMFMRSVAAEPLENEGNEFEESKMDNLTDKVQTDRNEVYRLEPGKELLNKNLRRGCREKARVPGGEADIRKGHEHIHGRIINQDSVLGRKTRVLTEPRDHEDTNLDKQVLVPGTKRGKFKKRSRKFALSSPKKRKKLEEGSEKLISKCRVVSHSQCFSPVYSEVDNDMRPEDQVSYNLSSSSAVNAVGSLTSHEQVDLSLVKTEPIESTDQDQGNAGIKLMETEATSWMKKEPDENNLMESSIETTIPVPVKLIRNEVINSGTPRPGMGTVILTNSHQQVGSTTKILKSVTTDMLEGPSINLERGQKIWYAVPKGDHSTIPISGTGSSDQRIVKVIKLDSVKNAPQTLLLPGNLKLCKLQKTPNMALCEGKEIPLSSVPSHRHAVADDTYTSDNEEDHEQKNLSSILNHKNEMLADNTCTFNQEEDQDEKNLMLKKIDSIIEKNLELMKKNQLPTMRKRGSNLTQKLFPSQNQVMGPHWCEKIDEETGKTTMVLMPTTGEEMTTKKTLPRIIYRSKNSGSKKKQKTDKWKKKIPVDEQIDGIIRKNLEMLKKIQLPEKIQSQPPQIEEKNENTDMVVVKNIVGEEKDGKPLNTVIYRFISSRRQSKQNITDTSCSKTPTPASPSLQLPDVALQAKETPVHNKPLMCNSFTQTKGDRSNVKKHETGIAVMVRDASTQSNTNLEKPSSFIEDGSVDILENSVGLTSPDVKISSHTGDTDLLMDVEEVDLSNLENKAPKDPLTTLRPMWRWAGRQTVSVGVNTGEACKDVWESVNPVDNQYTFGPIKEKERRKAVYKTERVKQHSNLSTKGQKMQKLIKRRKFLKNKQWEYNRKVAKLRLKFEQKKATSSEVVNKDLSIENTVVSADMATKQTQQFGMKDSTNDNSVGKVEDTNLDSNETKTDSSENDKHAAVELGTRTSSRIKACQVKALDNADLSGFFEHVQKKLKDVEEVEDVKSTTYITDSSDEEWQQMVEEQVTRKLKQLHKEMRNFDQSFSDSDSNTSEPAIEDDDTYSPDENESSFSHDENDSSFSPEETSQSPKPNKFIKVVVNPKLLKKASKIKPNLYLDIKLEDFPEMWERKLFTSNLRQERNVAVESKSYEEYRCLLCTGHHAFHTSAADLMESHIEEHLNYSFPCKECAANFDQQSLLTEHCQKEHSVTCEICNQEFSSKGLYKRHIGRMHGQRNIPCFKCDEKFKSKSLFKQHLLEAHPGSAQKCEKCGVILRSHLNAMQGHLNSKNCLRRQQGNLKTQCEICGKLFSENGIRKHKLRVHQKLRTFKCDVCSYAGITLQSLKDHKKTHTGEHPVKCTLCEFSCIKPYQLKCHMRTHLKLKPYKCDKCNYAASWNVQVKDHMRAHFSPTRVDCIECNISYKDQRGLNLHRLKEHGEGQAAKRDKVKNITSKKRGRPIRLMEGDEKPKSKRRASKKKLKELSSEEEYMDTDAEPENEMSEEEEKYVPRKSTRRRAAKKPNPQYALISGEEEYDKEEQEQADSYVPSISMLNSK
ncbi:uncharacterized protein LOC132551788 [Ylistrum balloti]|uniref:uncharacterized protein LOC132551788 n=1 Tax=Ylistrum balloti TaxID=509963 RepID=UPI0029058089|nr:uncharacterized protein LOC132551788 [Ylistrum balloti]